MFNEAAASEQWMPVEGYEGFYEVSDLGRVRSLPRLTSHGHWRKGKVLTVCEKNIYRYAVLASSGVNITKRIAILVCKAFHGPKPAPAYQVNHKDGDKHNDRKENLEWSTGSENQIHACQTGLRSLGEKSYQAKLTNAQVREIRSLHAAGRIGHRRLAARFGVCRTAISNILHKVTWKYI